MPEAMLAFLNLRIKSLVDSPFFALITIAIERVLYRTWLKMSGQFLMSGVSADFFG